MILRNNGLFVLLIILFFCAFLIKSSDVFAAKVAQNKVQYYANLWDRIQNGFALALPPNSKTFRKMEAPYVQNTEMFNQLLARSERYLFYIVEEVERRGMPMEIALLPIIESAYNPQAKSNRHAVGLWQFIPSTGKILGLEQNVWHDDRRDIVASTHAALDYLEYLYQKFDNWKLALAAYNLGETVVSRALAKNNQKGRSNHFYSLNLPTEAKHYVYRLLAVKSVIANAKKYQLKLYPIPNQPYFDEVQIHEHIDIPLATHLANISEVEFSALNPAYNRYVIKVIDEPRTLLLPKENKQVFLKNLETYQDPTITWRFYQVKKGEKIKDIATRHGTTVKQLQTINGITRNKNLILGQKILVPRIETSTQHGANNAQKKLQLSSNLADIYVVKKGDTLYEIAKRYGTTVDKLKLWNRSDEHLSIGQKLVIKS